MVNPDNVRRTLSEHFGQTTLDEFKDRHEKYVGGGDTTLAYPEEAAPGHEMILYQREAAPLRLNAYLATALTVLSEEEREHVFRISDLVGAVCNDLEIELYQPRKTTDPIQHPHVASEDVFTRDRERVLDSDLVIHIADYASTGAGEELDFALAALIPIVLVSQGETRVSRMVLGIPALKLIVTYSDLDELRIELRQRLTEIRPILEERKLSFSGFDNNIVGNKVRILREESQLTRDDLASHSGGLLTVERLRGIEENSDKISNPSLLELRALAAFLKTTVADLVEPDLQERVLVLLQEWLEGRAAARFGMSRNDRNKIITRMLLRIIDDLQRENSDG